MSDKRPVSGVVDQVSTNGKTQMSVGGRWYVLSPRATGVSLPPVGANVSFDAYGKDFDIFYRFTTNGGHSNGRGASVSNAGDSDAVGSTDNRVLDRAPGSPRSRALMAAATLLAGSDGTIGDLMGKTLLAAETFADWIKEEGK